ncbi:hypothetical protein ACA910_000063 [Epithemia clementina (nom. ined.)]
MMMAPPGKAAVSFFRSTSTTVLRKPTTLYSYYSLLRSTVSRRHSPFLAGGGSHFTCCESFSNETTASSAPPARVVTNPNDESFGSDFTTRSIAGLLASLSMAAATSNLLLSQQLSLCHNNFMGMTTSQMEEAVQEASLEEPVRETHRDTDDFVSSKKKTATLYPSFLSSSSSNLKRRMTSIGHFSILSETVHNPSICTFVMTLEATKDHPWTVDRFCKLWQKAHMPLKHPRFHWVAETSLSPFNRHSSISDKNYNKFANGYFVPEPSTSDEYAGTAGANVERHVTESLPPMMPRLDIIQRIQKLQTEPWDLSETLWHVDIVPWTKTGSAGTTSSVMSTERAPSKQDHDDRATRKRNTNTSPSSELGESILLFRGHHVLADGASLGAAWMDMADEAMELQSTLVAELKKRGLLNTSWWKRLMQSIMFVLWLFVGGFQSLWYQIKLFFGSSSSKSPWSVLEQLYYENHSGQDDRTSASRSVSFTTAGSVEQAKWVAQSLAGRKATVNDVFCSAVSKALAKQLEWHRQRFMNSSQTTETGAAATLSQKPPKTKSNQHGLLPPLNHTHLAVPVHLKGGVILPGESVSNSIGAFCVRIPCEATRKGGTTAQERLKEVHNELDFVKRLPTAFLGHYAAKIATQLLPASWVSWAFSRAHGGASCVVTNVRGFDRPIHMDGSEVLSMYGFVPLPPGIPIGVVVSSYDGKVHLTVSAQPWAVPDADQFLSWVLDEYLTLVQEASTAAATVPMKTVL